MRSIKGASSRAFITIAAAAATLLATAATATAHVRVDADNPTPGSYSVLTFKVPNESEKGALTTQLSVQLPNLTSVSTEVLPGWTPRMDRDVAKGTISSVTWTAAPGTGIGADQFALFRISVKLPQAQTLNLPTTQTYSDGTVVKWDQPTPPDGTEPEYPAPVVTMSGTATEAAGDHPVATTQASAGDSSSAADNSARWLAGGALVVAVAALVSTFLVRRRS